MKPVGAGANAGRALPAPHEGARPDSTKKSAFAKVLQEKAPGGKVVPGSPPRELGDPAAFANPVLNIAPFTNSPQGAEAVHSVALPKALEGLVQEIHASVSSQEAGGVQIQFDSKTLDGLNVKLSKDNGRLSVEMTSKSADVTRLLTQNVNALAQRLEAAGYAGASLQVKTAPVRMDAPVYAVRTAETELRDRGRRDQGDSKQGQRDQQRQQNEGRQK